MENFEKIYNNYISNGEIRLKLELNNCITDMSCMFYKCDTLLCQIFDYIYLIHKKKMKKNQIGIFLL